MILLSARQVTVFHTKQRRNEEKKKGVKYYHFAPQEILFCFVPSFLRVIFLLRRHPGYRVIKPQQLKLPRLVFNHSHHALGTRAAYPLRQRRLRLA